MQLALLGDWRVASEDSKITMWELKVGVACTIGSCILQRCLGRLGTTRIIYGCDVFHGPEAHRMGLVEDLVSSENLLAKALERAEQMGAYPAIPFSRTKRTINAPFIEELRDIWRISCEAHVPSFANNSANEHMTAVLHR